jgi:glycerophosphoryl diester phosphodiesterase
VRALAERDLLERAMVSTMETRSLVVLRALEPRLRLGWTYPRVTRAWDRKRWARPFVLGLGAAMRRRLPELAARRLPELGARLIWVYHPLVTGRLVTAVRAAGGGVVAWTVDDLERMRALDALEVDGICTNDPRLFDRLPARAP